MSEEKWFEKVFDLKNLFVPELELPHDFLLRGDILFKQHDKRTIAFVLLNNDENKSHPWIPYRKLFPYLKIASLFSIVSPSISGHGSHGIKSKDDFGKNPNTRHFEVSVKYDDREELLKDFGLFLNETKVIHERYTSIINEFPFMKRALDYYYDSKIDGVYDDDGFVKNMMSVEALFNESAQDIAYKLRVRIALLIGLTKFISSEVFEKFRELYDLRNKIVHGLDIPSDTNETRSILPKYSAEAMKIMLILCENRMESFKEKKYNSEKKKKAILTEIDEALTNPDKRFSLKEEIDSKIRSLRLSFEEKYEDRRWIVFRDTNAIRR